MDTVLVFVIFIIKTIMVSQTTSLEICKYYKETASIKKCADYFILNKQTIVNHLNKHNIIRPKITLNNLINRDYFKIIDKEAKAYFLGFILADGSLSKTSNRISFTINSNDDYILSKLKDELNTTNKVRRYKIYDNRTNKYSDTTVFQFSGKDIKNDIINHGIGVNKTTSFNIYKNIPNRYINHFLRGLIDGDGHISKTRPYISLISTKEFLNFINLNLFESKGRISVIQDNKNVYRLEVQNAVTCKSFLDYIYSNATIFLQRKFDAYKKQIFFAENQKIVSECQEIIALSKEDDTILNKFDSVKDCCNFYKIDGATLNYKIRKGNTFNKIYFIRGKRNKKIKQFNGINYFNNKLNDGSKNYLC